MRHVFPLAAAAIALQVTAAAAQDMPRYVPERWCEKVASSSGNRSEMIYGGCMDQEQSSYDEVKPRWSTLSAHTRRWCDQVSRANGSGSYMTLAGCIDMEESSGRENKKRSFKY
jgi:hypothetical protein